MIKNTCINASAVALPVFSKTQIVSTNALMLVASTETICPSQTRVKPNIPVGRFVVDMVILDKFWQDSTSHKKKQPHEESCLQYVMAPDYAPQANLRKPPAVKDSANSYST